VLAVVFGVIMYRVILLSLLFVSQDEMVNKFAKIVTSITAALINLVAILILNRVSIMMTLYLCDSAVTLLVGRQEGRPSCEKLHYWLHVSGISSRHYLVACLHHYVAVVKSKIKAM